MKRAMMISAMALLVASAVLAGPFQPAQVPADAKWVAHVDVEAGLASQIGKFTLTQIPAEELQKGVKECLDKAGFDPTKDVKSITAYGTAYDEKSLAAVAEIKLDKAKVIEAIGKKAGHKESTYNGQTIHEWTKQDKPAEEGAKADVMYGCFVADNKIVLAASMDSVQAAIDVLAGKKDSLAKGGDLAAMVKPSAGSLVFMAARDIALPDEVPAAGPLALIKKVKTGTMEICEADKKFSFKVTGAMTAAEDADQARKMLAGLLAMVSMVDPAENPGAADAIELVKGITVGGENAGVTITGSWDVEKLQTAIKHMSEMKAQQKNPPVKPDGTAPAPTGKVPADPKDF
ncbi:MAG: hypothetical protein PHU85_08845 [Phycisphaerae bacterium]|nr:hypothetical protein [Phycisphaerae bacterium]